MKWQRSVVWCSCGSHALAIGRDKIDGKIYTELQFFTADSSESHNSLAYRVRSAWAALRGVLYLDGICLEDENEVQKLIEALQKEPTNWEDEE